ncbi:hypothetical protein Tco_0850688 [Tanacetum coccineum]
MEAVVQQCSVDKQCFEIYKKELFLDNDRLLHQIMSQDVLLTVMNSTTVYGDFVNLEMQSSESLRKFYVLKCVKRVILFSIHNDEWKSFQCHHQTALRMSMLVKDTRSQDGIDDKDNDKGSKSRPQSMKEQVYNKEQRERPRPHELNDKSNLSIS